MTISIPLDDELESRIRVALKNKKLSDFVREAIMEKLAREQKTGSAYNLGKDVFGRYSSGHDDLSINRKAIVRDKIHAKHSG